MISVVESRLKWQYRLETGESVSGIPINDLSTLLKSTTHLDSTDPRDKIYLLLGVDEAKDITIEPDYTKSTVEVYTDFVLKYISCKKSLSVISEGGIGVPRASPPLDLPSWVPDFRHVENRGQTIDSTNSGASGSLALNYNISHQALVLTARCVVADTTISMLPNPRKWPLNSWSDLVLEIARTTTHPTGISQYQAFFRTMILDKSGYGFGKPGFQTDDERVNFFDLAVGFMGMLGISTQQNHRIDPILTIREELLRQRCSDYAALFAIWMGAVPESIDSASDETLLAPFLAHLDPSKQLQWPQTYNNYSGKKLSLHYHRTACICAVRKSFFISKKGYMGLGPPGSRVGDEICIVFGCDKPLLIRRSEGSPQIVGPCYVYGLMHGEIEEQLENGTVESEMLEFR